MICRCFGKAFDLGAIGANTSKTAHLMLGVFDYDAYILHMNMAHADQTPLTRAAYFAARQQARFARGGLRCC